MRGELTIILRRLGVAIATAMVLFAQPALAQSSTYSVQAKLTLLERLSVVNTASLDFGQIAATPAGGTVVLTPGATPTCNTTGGLVQFGPCQPAGFSGYGSPNQIFRIKLPVGRQINITGPGGTMLIDDMNVDGDPTLTQVNGNNGNGFVRYRIASATGLFAFRVGGTLNVNANQLPGIYTGTFEVRVDYQ